MMVSNRNLLFQGAPIFRFHVCFGGCRASKKLWAIFVVFFSPQIRRFPSYMASFPGPHVFGIAAKALEGWPGGIFLGCAKTRRGGGKLGSWFLCCCFFFGGISRNFL